MTSLHRMRRRRTRLLALALAGAFVTGGCAANGEGAESTSPETGAVVVSSAETAAETVTVSIERSRFGEAELRVAPGTTVVWRNDDAFAHTVTTTDDAPVSFDSGEFADGATFEFTFDEPGEYSYFCQIHPTMRAVVIVG